VKKGLFNVVFILDRSGSMESIWSDAKGAYAQFVTDQKAVPGDAFLTLVLFDDRFQIVQDMVPIQQAYGLETGDGPRGSTALIDACCRTIDHIGRKLEALPEDERPEKTIVAIMTDGMENASREFTADQLKDRIERQRDTYGWEFLFLGANQDSFATAGALGVQQAFVANFVPTGGGICKGIDSVSRSVSSLRKGGTGHLSDDSSKGWKQ